MAEVEGGGQLLAKVINLVAVVKARCNQVEPGGNSTGAGPRPAARVTEVGNFIHQGLANGLPAGCQYDGTFGWSSGPGVRPAPAGESRGGVLT